MANNWDWIYATYFKLEEETTFDTIIGYFDPTLSDGAEFDPYALHFAYRMNIWSSYQDLPNSCMPVVASFTGDFLSSDSTPGVFEVSNTGVDRVFPVCYGPSPEPIWRLVFKLDEPVTLPAGVYFFSHDAVVLGPITSDVVADPNPVAFDGAATLTAVVDDSMTGGDNIASAEFSIDGGSTWTPMAATDGTFDSPTEDVTADFSPDSLGITDAGIYTLCVRGQDSAGNVGGAECIQLVVYDPSAGFVTGGGWINSPEGAMASMYDSTVSGVSGHTTVDPTAAYAPYYLRYVGNPPPQCQVIRNRSRIRDQQQSSMPRDASYCHPSWRSPNQPSNPRPEKGLEPGT